MKSLADNLLAKGLERLANAIFKHPRWFVWPQFVLFGLCVLYTVRCLEFDNDRSHLVGADKRYHRNYQEFRKDFAHQDDMVVVVESEDSEKNRQFVERLGAKLEVETNLFRGVFFKGDLKMMGNKALLFVPEPDLQAMQRTLADYRPFIQKFSQATNLITLFDQVNRAFGHAKQETNAENNSLIKALPALERIVNRADDSLHRQGTPPSPGVNALFGAGDDADQQIYLTFGGGRLYLVNCHAASTEVKVAAVERLTALVEETRAEVPGVNAGVTGEPVLEHDEMRQSQRDSTLASVVSLVLCALIFIYAYRETGRPLKAVLCLIIGIGYTMGFATLVIKQLNILTTSFVPILIGMAIDFGVHLITRYEEELRHGKTQEEALTKAMVFTGQGIFTGAFTTAGAFLAMWFTNFKGIQEMGIICGGGLLICLIPMMTLLPVLLLRGRQNVLDHLCGGEPLVRARIESLWLKRPVFVLILTVVLTGLAASQLRKIYFDYNLLHMQSAGLPAVEFEQKLINSAGKSVLYGAIIADSLEKAVSLEGQLTNLSSVAKTNGVISMASFLTGDQSGKLRAIGEIKQSLAAVQFAAADLQPVNVPELSRTLYSFKSYLGAALQEIGTNEPALSQQLTAIRGTVENLRREMLRGDAKAQVVIAQKLAEYQQAFFNDVRETFSVLQNQDNTGPLRAQDLPKSLRDRFIGVTGKYLLQVYPEKDVWQRENQKEFIAQLRTIDPNVTGTPIQLYEYTELLKTSYEQAALYSLGAIVLLVMVHFRSLSSVLLALLPVAIGSIWLGGLMAVFGVPFNPANIMTLPLVLGIGVTNGIHILNRFAEEQQANILAHSTGKAVFVSGLTTIAGFGSLVLAQHQGIRSLGYVMAAGVTTCMIAGLTFLPALLGLMQKKQPSADNARSAPGREEPRQNDLKH